ncbi:MAG: APC family permease [Gammaproteobacteria bacterium]|nr:APC family permease [Gammaproteobacteria bacterium]
MSVTSTDAAMLTAAAPSLHRKISWTGAFWVASGVPALVLFSIGAIAATVGRPAWVVWTVSILFGFIQAFTYAEIAGLFPSKSGGASIYGAVAWARYNKFFAPVSVWCNWFAWSPVLAIGSGLTAGYVLDLLFPDPNAAIKTWQITLLNLGFLKDGLTLRINATFFLGAFAMLVTFLIQHGGILKSARATMILAVAALVPLMLVSIVPLLTGDVPAAHFSPLVPLGGTGEDGKPLDGAWNTAGWTLMAGGLFIAAWSTYAFETSVCYTREFMDPQRDTFKAILYSGLLCIAAFVLIPLGFQANLGLDGMLAPDIYSGMGVAAAMSKFLGGGVLIEKIFVVMMILALMLSIMTAMAGSSRTLYQASVDGWLPRYLSHCNDHGAPTRAMGTDLVFNLFLLLLSDYVFLLAISNVGYIIFNFLNLNAGWIHRLDRPHWPRPWKASNLLLGLGAVLGFVNMFIMGMGAGIWGQGTLMAGLVFSALILPVFWYRHYVQDQGQFPAAMLEDMHLGPDEAGVQRRAGVLPWVAVAGGIAACLLGHTLGA